MDDLRRFAIGIAFQCPGVHINTWGHGRSKDNREKRILTMSDIQQTVSMIIEDHHIEVEKSLADLLKTPPVRLTIDGKDVEVPATSLAEDPATKKPFARPTTIYDAALKLGIKIPI